MKAWLTDLLDKRGRIALSGKASKKKIGADSFVLPTAREYDMLQTVNFNVSQLRQICKSGQVRCTGNKEQLRSRAYHLLFLTNQALVIQAWCRKNEKRQFAKKGPWSTLRKPWVNTQDVLEMEDLSRDDVLGLWPLQEKEHVFVFTLGSFAALIKSGDAKNPYTNNPIPPNCIDAFRDHLRRATRTGVWKPPVPDAPAAGQPPARSVRDRLRACFARMDQQGFYTQPEWLEELGAPALIRFMAEVADIWSFRAGLTRERQVRIWNDPLGFWYQNGRITLPQHYCNRPELCLRAATGIIERLLTDVNDPTGTDLATMYILMAITLVSQGAREALPIMYEAARHTQPAATD